MIVAISISGMRTVGCIKWYVCLLPRYWAKRQNVWAYTEIKWYNSFVIAVIGKHIIVSHFWRKNSKQKKVVIFYSLFYDIPKYYGSLLTMHPPFMMVPFIEKEIKENNEILAL